MEKNKYRKDGGQNQPRRRIVVSNSLATNSLSYKKPLMVAWWSLAFPGFGHFLLGNHLFGVILVVFEFLINTLSGLNTAIYFSMLGDFQEAKEAIELKYFFVYIPIYIFAVWDSYRKAIELNMDIELTITSKEKFNINPFHLSILEVNSLRKKNTAMTLLWAFIMPPMLYIYIHRFITLVFTAIWWGALLYFTNIMEAVYYSAIGEFSKTKEILDPQWVLNLPSVYTFTIFDVHTKAIENNKMYELEMIHHLRSTYQEGSLEDLFT
ncbi:MULTISPECIES: hypothetical protein [Bacillaceae]|uniref:Uncharacterized protein n=1 Tax=Evansella alkalicola TaxID=745819 RepID=A0ABS6K2K7_9BACI|nr:MULTISPECIES: hypothetical protein [Bacillaceae]MBU9724320.1 hypothetical protein [Bacillus alkalicola]